ncbi:lipoprotein-releasing ABC transporter permease subunit [Neopusillimonas maritima]|uniref:Lipoprotein-releasing system transmembrane subunit LolC n=1 Tax=Neopusillimonas maritima TaxID=2026239 RepID=A0A3A1YQ59_9BURK|nr:lipoprotein-releasing ABC transporter permease subunit [Neopusillimonas maritima]RIY39626.1 lipoprotein-releasing system transmembrane subunit LolC [Neopusillimonas maritima]
MAYEFWIGARYAGLARVRGRSGRRDRFVSFIAASSMAGIALGVAALIIVLSVMNGFQTQVRDRMLSVLPHIELFVPGATPMQSLEQWQSIAAKAAENDAVSGAAPFVSAQAMLARGSTLVGTQLRGVDPSQEQAVSDLHGQMIEGDLSALTPGSFEIVLGNQLARSLGVLVGDAVMVLAAQGSVSPAGFSPRMRQFTVAGIYSSGYYEYDASLAFVNVEDAARVFRDSGAAGVRLRIHDMQQAPLVARELAFDIQGVGARDWTQNNRTWFAAVQTEKRMMFLILALIVAVAAFNLLSSLVMAVKDKQSDIAILRTLGATPREIGRIFLIQGALIGVVGTVLGVALGMLVAYNIDVIVPFIENLMGIEFLPQQIYFISELPSNPQMSDIVTIALTSLILSLLATLYPSWRASRLQPARVLRHD